MSENSSRLILFRLTNPLKCGIIHSLHSLILRSKFTFGKNVGFACHIFERCELCSNRSETAFFGAWFRLRTFLYTWRYDYEKGSMVGTNLVACLSVRLSYYLYRAGLTKGKHCTVCNLQFSCFGNRRLRNE